MKNVINFYKKVGITPLQAINQFKSKNPKYKSKKIGYAGRLDPMAEGVLLFLVEEEGKKISNYLKLNKEYNANIKQIPPITPGKIEPGLYSSKKIP